MSLLTFRTGSYILSDAGPDSHEYIPGEYQRILGRIYDLRTIIENSNEVVVYNRSGGHLRKLNIS